MRPPEGRPHRFSRLDAEFATNSRFDGDYGVTVNTGACGALDSSSTLDSRPMKEKPRVLKEYISSVLDDIEDALKAKKGYSLRSPIKFSIAIVNTTSRGGGLKIYVVGAEGKHKSEEISRIEFSIHPPRT